jgi:predicted thioesterase
MHNIPIGAKREEQLLVTSEVAISFLQNDHARVLATPEMIRYMERTSRNLAVPLLEPGHDTVGTHVNVSHNAAAPMGSVVVFTAEIAAVRDRRIEFHVVARMGDEVIGEGSHERAIINVEKFAARMATKQGKPI